MLRAAVLMGPSVLAQGVDWDKLPIEVKLTAETTGKYVPIFHGHIDSLGIRSYLGCIGHDPEHHYHVILSGNSDADVERMIPIINAHQGFVAKRLDGRYER